MSKAFMMKLSEIQPSQLYISSEKLSEIMKTFDSANPELIELIPIKKLGNEIVFVDGHTRAAAAFLRGFSEVPVY
jgi:ParB-like chromosome segregation protein Spo0J